MGRMITQNIWEDDFIVSLSFFDRLVWIGLITIADDQGRMQDSANLVRSKMFPMDDVPLADIESALVTFSKAGKIARYIANGKKMIQIIHWWKHQRPNWAGESLYPADEGWIDRVRCHVKGNQILSKNWDSEGGYIAGYIAGNKGDYLKRDVKGEDDVKNEESTPSDDFQGMVRIIQSVTGVPPFGADSIKAINDLIEMQATEDDIKAGYNWYLEQGKKFRYYGSIIGAVRTAQAKRLAKPLGKIYQAPPEVGHLPIEIIPQPATRMKSDF